MTYTVDTDLWDLRQRINILEVNSDKHNMRLNKLEDGRDDKVMSEEVEGVDFSHTIPGKGYETATVKIDPLASQKEVALDWYINQYQNMCKEYNKVKIKLDEKQKVLEMVMDQRGRYVKQLMDAEKKVKELESANCDLEKSNQILRGTKENFKDRIFELEKEVKYQAAFANSGKIKELEDAARHKAVAYDKLDHENQILKEDIAGAHAKVKELELDIKYLEDKNRFISDLNDEYRKMVVNDVNEMQEIIEMIWEIRNPILSEEKCEIVEKINKMIRSMQGSE